MGHPPISPPPISLIVPIYNARDCLPGCLDAVAALDPPPDEVILIEDASTDPAVRPLLRQFIRERDLEWLLVLHRENRGFVRTANQGMQLAGGHCLLLNQDTLAERRLIAKLRQALASADDIATITPFSNNGEIVSLPGFCRNNPVPGDIETLARACAAAGPPQYPELPTAVGFCMLVTRRALDELGLFDAETYGHGYGEENDYSCRASAVGLRNILCDNAYVAHIGNRSFAERGLQPNDEALRKVLDTHPDYLQRVRAFITADPLKSRRDAIIGIWQQHRGD